MQCAPASALTMLLLMMLQGCCLVSCKCICYNSAHALARLMQLPLQPFTPLRDLERGVKALIQLLLQLLCTCSCYAHAMLLLMMLEGCRKDSCNCS